MFMDNLDRICKDRDTSASAVCIAVGLSKNSPSNWRKSGAIPKEDSLMSMAKHLRCKVSDFFRDESERTVEYSVIKLDEVNESIDSLASAISSGLAFDENVAEFMKIYSRCATVRQRHQLMDAVYDFEDKVLSAEKETC